MHGMALTDDISKRIERKRQEVAALEQQIMAAKAYIQAMDEALKMAERTTGAATTSRDASKGIRKGSMPAKAYPVLKRAGRPMYVVALLEAMGLPVTMNNKRTLASSLSAYSRKKDVFNRPEPNTFGLIEFGESVGHEEVESA